MFKKKVPEAPTPETPQHVCHTGHQWVEARRYSARPGSHPPGVTSAQGSTADEVMRLIRKNMQGWTSVELRCLRCGDIKQEEFPYTG